MKKNLRLGSRGSPLALIQAGLLRDKICAAHPALFDKNAIEIVPIRTSGDWKPEHKERMFLEIGADKSLFTKEIEEALHEGHIDMAIHSMKDVQSIMTPGLEIAAIIERDDPRDAFISSKARSLAELPVGSVVGTSSLRRQAQILAKRPDLRVTPLRGNVDTRLRKLANGDADATILAVAGLKRLGAEASIAAIMGPDEMLPCAGQGALGVEIRSDNADMRTLLTPLNSTNDFICVSAERAFLVTLEGSCHTPIGALAQLSGDEITLDVMAARPDGTSILRTSRTGLARDAENIGHVLGEEFKSQLPPDFFAEIA